MAATGGAGADASGLRTVATMAPLSFEPLHRSAMHPVFVPAYRRANAFLPARLLALMPWKRRVPFNARLVWQALRLAPRPGSIADRMPQAPARHDAAAAHQG